VRRVLVPNPYVATIELIESSVQLKSNHQGFKKRLQVNSSQLNEDFMIRGSGSDHHWLIGLLALQNAYNRHFKRVDWSRPGFLVH